jgi:hypothetical protein
MCYNESDIEYLSDEINELYHRFVKVQLFIGGMIIINSLVNTNLLCSIKTKIIELKTVISPPLYKIIS